MFPPSLVPFIFIDTRIATAFDYDDSEKTSIVMVEPLDGIYTPSMVSICLSLSCQKF